MLALICILAFASSNSVEVVDEVYKIPGKPGWRYFELGLKQRPARVMASFETPSGSRRVRLALMRGDDLERMRAGMPHGWIAMTELGAAGSMEYAVHHPGDYVLVVDNQAREATDVHVRVSLDFGDRSRPDVTRLSPQRQLSVIALSFAFFFGVVTYSARKLLRSVRR